MLIYAQTMCKIYRYNSEGNQRVKEYLVSTLSKQYADKFSPRRIVVSVKFNVYHTCSA